MAGGTFFLKRRPAVVWGGVAFLRKRYLHPQNIPTKNTKTSGGMTGRRGIDGLPSIIGTMVGKPRVMEAP